MIKPVHQLLPLSLLIVFSFPAFAQTEAKAAAAIATAHDPQPFLSEKKIAIVIGISDYPEESGFPKLKYAAKDAQDLAGTLKKQGYQTRLLTDQDALKSKIREALQQAEDQLHQDTTGSAYSPHGTILFAFSGHGGQSGTGVNKKQYLATYDADARGGDFGFPLKEVSEALTASGAARKMMFIDACRDAAASSKGALPLSSFRELRQAEGIKTFFSTAPGARSFEDDDAQHGKFTRYLLEGLSGKAASPDGLVTFDSLARWVMRAMQTDSKNYQIPYWNQSASGDFYIAGQLAIKQALVIGIDHYPDRSLHSAIAGAKQIEEQLGTNGFDTSLLENPQLSELAARIGDLGKNMGPGDVALFYFAGEGGIASGKPFLMASDSKLPQQAVNGKWEKPPENSISLVDVIDKVRQNHPGPNLFFLDMGLMRASPADVLELAALRREHTLILFSSKPGQEPERSPEGSLFSRSFLLVLKEPKMSASYAASKVISAVFDQSNGVQYVIEIPMLPDRVYLTPSQ